MKICSKCNIEKDESEFHNCYRARNKAWCKACGIKSNMKSYRNNYIQAALKRAERGAKTKGLEFNLTEADLVMPANCPVLGIPLIMNGGLNAPNNPSLDRIDNRLGYIKGNVIVVSDRANRLKNNATIEELIRISEFYSKFIK
jgi:hypothetical protein